MTIAWVDTVTIDDDLLHLDLLGPTLARGTGDDRWLSLSAALIPGGKSNLTFEITSEAGSAIVRRPPSGGVLPSAHDMVREARVQSALWTTSVPVAKILMVHTKSDVMGAPFYVMEKVPGSVMRDEIPRGYADSPNEKKGIANTLIDVLAELHSIDPESIGLGDFGKPEGYLERQLKRWGQQWELTKTFEVKALDELAGRLRQLLPRTSLSSIVHGDYRLDNCMMSLDTPSVMNAVLDWELSSLGDPLSDLGLALFYWREAFDIPLSLIPRITGTAGFPARSHLAERYALKTETDLYRSTFYEAFARYKYAVIAQGILVRGLNGVMAGQTFGDLKTEIVAVADEGLRLALQSG
ncbi:MAG: phosphotransferase family protein [Acidimicrobiales bacterium]